MDKNKKLIFTVNLGGYDKLEPVTELSDGFDYICFSDDKSFKSEGWKTVYVKPNEDLKKQSREIKINIHKFVKGYDLYVYIDSNYKILIPLDVYVARNFKQGLLLHVHKDRNCTYKEANRVLELNMENYDTVDFQMRKYSSSGFPRTFGLFENGFLIRDNSVNSFMELWFNEIKQHSYRDQLSLPYCLWKYKPKISTRFAHEKNRYIRLHDHIKQRTLPAKVVQSVAPKVWYFTPGRGDKNLGRSYNDHCEIVPDGDWICIRDGDTIFLNPYWSKQIEDIITRHSGRFPLISCVTNRLGLEWQLPYGFSEDPDILNHAKIADDLFEKRYDEVTTSERQTAGLFMLFPKSTWDKVKFKEGLTNGGQFVDFTFADSVMKQLGKIGIAQGIYLFHFYRFNRKHKRDIEHLL